MVIHPCTFFHTHLHPNQDTLDYTTSFRSVERQSLAGASCQNKNKYTTLFVLTPRPCADGIRGKVHLYTTASDVQKHSLCLHFKMHFGSEIYI